MNCWWWETWTFSLRQRPSLHSSALHWRHSRARAEALLPGWEPPGVWIAWVFAESPRLVSRSLLLRDWKPLLIRFSSLSFFGIVCQKSSMVWWTDASMNWCYRIILNQLVEISCSGTSFFWRTLLQPKCLSSLSPQPWHCVDGLLCAFWPRISLKSYGALLRPGLPWLGRLTYLVGPRLSQTESPISQELLRS